jgi:dephospho-CoA kinase
MKWIGLTGGLATGKSTVSQMLKSWGYPVIDADQIAKDVVDPGSLGLQAVVSQFGPGKTCSNCIFKFSRFKKA